MAYPLTDVEMPDYQFLPLGLVGFREIGIETGKWKGSGMALSSSQ